MKSEIEALAKDLKDRIDLLSRLLKDQESEQEPIKPEKGKWYYGEVEKDVFLAKSTGEIKGGEFYHSGFITWNFDYHNHYTWTYTNRIKRLATPQEIETALSKVAEKKGFKPGVTVRRSDELLIAAGMLSVNYTSIIPVKTPFYTYSPLYDYLVLGGVTIYCNGIWAEVVEYALTIGGHEVKYDNGPGLSQMVHIGCRSFTRQAVNTTYSHALNLGIESITINRVEVTLAQIKQILDGFKK